nr:phytoene synthase 2, chloroplastic-like [Ipomoea batatas]
MFFPIIVCLSVNSQDELTRFGLSDEDIFAGKVSDKWREFMKEHIRRARFYINLARRVLLTLTRLVVCRKILDAIEENEYDNLTKRAYVGRLGKLVTLPLAYSRAQSVPSLAF